MRSRIAGLASPSRDVPACTEDVISGFRNALESARRSRPPGVAEGFRYLGLKDDHDINAAEWILYDALYAYRHEMVRQGKPGGMFRS